MPIYRGNTKVVSLYRGTTKIVKVYKGTNVVYTSSRLPAEFQEVEYIESSGTQYIDTGSYLNPSQIKLEIELQLSNVAPLSNQFLFGSQDRISGAFLNYFEIFLKATDSKIICNVGKANTGTTDLEVATATADKTKISLELVNNNYTATAFNNIINGAFAGLAAPLQRTQFLFARNNEGNAITFASYKLYSCKIEEQNVLTRNFVPCYRKSDNVIGLYDTVHDVFYVNAGSGTFTKGQDVL